MSVFETPRTPAMRGQPIAQSLTFAYFSQRPRRPCEVRCEWSPCSHSPVPRRRVRSPCTAVQGCKKVGEGYSPLVGVKPMATGTAAEQSKLGLLDAVLYLSARPIQSDVKPLGGPNTMTQRDGAAPLSCTSGKLPLSFRANEPSPAAARTNQAEGSLSDQSGTSRNGSG